MSATFYGEWSRILGSLQKVEQTLTEVVRSPLEDFGEAVKRDLQRLMKSNSYAGSKATAKKKSKSGSSGGSWYMWGELHDHGIAEVTAQKRGLGNSAVNVSFSKEMHSTGVSYESIALWLENGTRTQPPRPIIGPKLAAIAAGTDSDLVTLQKEIESELADKIFG